MGNIIANQLWLTRSIYGFSAREWMSGIDGLKIIRVNGQTLAGPI